VARPLKLDPNEMQSTAEHTGLSARDGEDQGRVGDRGGDGVGGRSRLGADRRAGKSRVFPLGGTDGLGFRIGDLEVLPIPVVPAHLRMDAARKVAALKRISLLLVERDERLVGFIGERALATEADAMPIAAVMKPLGACLRPGMSAAQARALFSRTGAAVLPVIAGGFVLGAVSRGAVERA
jgi:CBS domain-containing protein